MTLKDKFTNALNSLTDRLSPTDISKTTWMQSHAFYEPANKEYAMGIAKLQQDGTWNAKVLHGTDTNIMYSQPADALGEKLSLAQAVGVLEKFDQEHAKLHRRREFFANVPYVQKIKRAAKL